MKRFGMQEENADREGRTGHTGAGSPETDAGDSSERETAEDILSLYLEELKAIRPLTEAEEAEALQKAGEGDRGARERLIESYLMPSLSIVKDFIGGEMGVSEMIGVSNLSLVTAVEEYIGRSKAAGEGQQEEETGLSGYVRAAVRAALKQAETEERCSRQRAETVAERVNQLMEAARVMATELGREASPEELAERLRTPEEEVRALLKMSVQAME